MSLKHNLEVFAQATLDAMGPPPTQEEMPSATRWSKTTEESEIETGNPENTQMQGVMVNTLPRETKPDDRIIELLELLHAEKNKNFNSDINNNV